MSELKEYRKFRSLLRECVGPDRTQAEFAKAAGISPEHLSRMLNQPKIGCPGLSTLSKISACSYNGTTVRQLMDSLQEDAGPDEAEAGPGAAMGAAATPYDKAKSTVLAVKAGLEAAIKPINGRVSVFTSPFDMIEAAAGVFAACGVVYDICDDGTGTEPDSDGKQRCLISMSREFSGYIASFGAVIHYITVQPGMIIGGSVEMDNTDAFAFIPADIYHMCEIREDGIYCILENKRDPEKAVLRKWSREADRKDRVLRDGVSAADLLLEAIFGKPGSERPVTYTGYGFYTDAISEKAVLNFLLAHKDTMRRTDTGADVGEALEKGSALKDAFPDYEKFKNVDSTPWFECVAEVMYEETMISFQYFTEKKDPAGNVTGRPCVMFRTDAPWEYNDIEKELTEKGLHIIVDKYARELKTETPASIYYLTVTTD